MKHETRQELDAHADAQRIPTAAHVYLRIDRARDEIGGAAECLCSVADRV